MKLHSDLLVDVTEGDRLAVRFPYDAKIIALVKAVPGRSYHPEGRYWTIPAFGLRDLQSSAARAGLGVVLSEAVAQAQARGHQARAELARIKQLEDASLTLPTRTPVRNYQRIGVLFLLRALRDFKGALLADDLGTGKTLQALSVVALSPLLRNVLVLCPASVKYVWAGEIDKHYPSLTYTVVGGTAEERRRQWAEPTRIKVANYELLLRDATLRVRDWDLVIADECAAYIKSYRAKRTRLAKGLRRRYSLGLSGTPIENRLEELHSIMDFVMPGLLGPGWLFVAQHCVKNRFGATVGYRNIDKVRGRIAPHYLRRTKAEVLPELPAKTYSDVWLEMTPEEWLVYDAIRQQIKAYILENPKLRVANVLTEMLRLKQCADDLGLLGEHTDGPSTKTAALADLLEAAEGHQLVAYTQFAQYALRLGRRMGAPVLYGDLDAGARAALIKDFQVGRYPLLLSTEVGAYGIELTAADIVVHLDQPWNPARLRQREDRLHRLGQRHNVQVVSLLARRTIDEYVRQVIHRKRTLAQAVLGDGDDEGVARSLTKRDLLALLGEEADG